MPTSISSITGRGWEFPPHLNDRNEIAMVQDDADIRQAIFIILNTAPGERVMRPEFGCNIHEMIFWPANEQTAAIVERMVTDAIKRWEPRITLRRVAVTPGVEDFGELMIEISYEIKKTHDVRSLVYPFYLTPA
jgi:uncharacterized protein